MAWRAIQDTVGRSESLANVSDLAERIYWRLLAHSDSWGRLAGSPKKLRALCYPLLEITDQQAGFAFIELEQVDRIRVYEKNDEWFVQIVDFEENQPREAYRKRVESRFPDGPKHPSKCSAAVVFRLRSEIRSGSGQLPETPANSSASGSVPEKVRGEEKRREEKVPKETAAALATPTPAAAENQLLEDLERVGWNRAQLQAATAQPELAQAWLDAAANEATTNAGGYAWTGFATGQPPIRAAAPAQRRSPGEVAENWIRNVGWTLIADTPADVIDELESMGCDELTTRRLLQLAEELKGAA